MLDCSIVGICRLGALVHDSLLVSRIFRNDAESPGLVTSFRYQITICRILYEAYPGAEMIPDSLALGIRGLDPLSIDLIIDHTLPWPGSYTNDSYICMYPAHLLDQETGS